MLHLLLAGSAALLLPQDAGAPPWTARVDALFSAWDRPDSPGCALGVIQERKLVHARGFGSASLEHGVPIGPATEFDVGSTSKQFTAAAIGPRAPAIAYFALPSAISFFSASSGRSIW